MSNDTPQFSNSAEEAEYWKRLAGEYKAAAEEAKTELEEFQEGSRELEHELESQLEQAEAKMKEVAAGAVGQAKIISDKAGSTGTKTQAKVKEVAAGAVDQAKKISERAGSTGTKAEAKVKEFAAGAVDQAKKVSDKAGSTGTRAEAKVKKLAAAHIFTGCGARWGVLGVAYVGTICGGAWATGANKIHGGSSPWLTFAHELGHTFAGKHSFEDGQGKTGGVMDYGNGKLNGHYQFNTKYRKKEMCAKMDQKVDRCNGNFQKDSGAPPTSPTTPGPTSPPSPTDKKCSFESRSDLGCGMWMNARGDNFDWTQKSGKTPSCGTGPSAASDGSQYIYIETSSPRRTGDKAKLQTKSAVKLGASSTLKFDYHMQGRSVGKLQVLVGSDVVFEKAGSQANGWHTETLKLDKYAGKSSTVAFVASRGKSWSGDIAIDNVHFDTGGGGSGGPTTLPPTTKKPEPEPEPTTEAPTTKKPEPEPEPTTAPPGGGGSLEKKVDALEKKADEILKILKGLVGSSGGSR